ncbi:hybrid signal transduction histidine kinase A isoform X2 [Teleopsis dalmanni]|uniref:hybrid signal transduction histidine kinase A isoform X2 n=1 Tax=Teleopsis dalmanni TaxID=139649 RepID=UPI0018CE1398|nr:hybrid signal transduction histidine kinase A isoform X2 [Teleopsis dalmanni]
MSLNRRRNICNSQYSDPRFQIKRQTKDLFERDPFKIQSYNFHYAERPAFPVQNLVSRPIPTSRAESSFQTFFMNYKFTPSTQERENDRNKFHECRRRKYLQESKVNINCPLHGTSSRVLNNGLTESSIHNRSYQAMGSRNDINYLQSSTRLGSNQQSNSRRNNYSSTVNSVPTTSPYLRSVCNRDYLRSPSQTNTGANAIYDRSARSRHNINQHERLATSTSNVRATTSGYPFSSISPNRSRRSLYERRFPDDLGLSNIGVSRSKSVSGNLQPSADMASTISERNQCLHPPLNQTNDTPTRSGCQININIKNLDNDTDGEHFTINIETNDDCDFDENIDRNNNMNSTTSNRTNTLNTLQEDNIVHTYNNPTTIVTTPYSTDSMVINQRASNYSIPARVPSNEYLHAALIKPIAPNFDQDPPKYSEIRPLPADLKKFISKERLPALIPVKVNDCRTCFLEEEATSPRPQHKPIIKRTATANGSAPPKRKPKTLLETLNVPRKSCLKQTTVNKTSEDSRMKTISKPVPVNRRTSQHQSLRYNYENPSVSTNCPKRTQSQGCSFRRTTSPLIIRSNCELSNSPVNVNINVYTDKLKLLRV